MAVSLLQTYPQDLPKVPSNYKILWSGSPGRPLGGLHIHEVMGNKEVTSFLQVYKMKIYRMLRRLPRF